MLPIQQAMEPGEAKGQSGVILLMVGGGRTREAGWSPGSYLPGSAERRLFLPLAWGGAWCRLLCRTDSCAASHKGSHPLHLAQAPLALPGSSLQVGGLCWAGPTGSSQPSGVLCSVQLRRRPRWAEQPQRLLLRSPL